MYGLIGEGRPLETELDFLVACIEHMRGLPPLKQPAFRAQMEEYFRLPEEMRDSFVYDTLVQLQATKAGTLKGRDPAVLRRIHELTNGEYFRLDTRLAVFREHHRLGKPQEGWFTYVYPTEFVERSLDYHEAWSLATEGRLTFGQKMW